MRFFAPRERSARPDIALLLAGIMTLWLGILSIGEKAGAVNLLARITAPFFSRIFPEVPKNHPATGDKFLRQFSWARQRSDAVRIEGDGKSANAQSE